MQTTARSIKATIVLDAIPLATVQVPNGASRVTLIVATPGRTLRAEVGAKSMRRAVAAINLHGPAGVSCILQGKLGPDGHEITEAGIAVQPKVTQPAQAEAA